MINKPNYVLYRFTYWRKNDNNPMYYFIISSDWGSAFNTFYDLFDIENVTISSVDLCAREEIDMTIDPQYLIDNRDFAPISVNGVNLK